MMRRASQTKQLRCGCCCFTWINLPVSAVWGEKKPDMRLIYYVSLCGSPLPHPAGGCVPVYCVDELVLSGFETAETFICYKMFSFGWLRKTNKTVSHMVKLKLWGPSCNVYLYTSNVINRIRDLMRHKWAWSQISWH